MMRILKYIPKKFVKNKVQKKRALKQDTPLNWIKHNKKDKIKAFLQSVETWEKIPGWDDFEIINNNINIFRFGIFYLFYCFYTTV